MISSTVVRSKPCRRRGVIEGTPSLRTRGVEGQHEWEDKPIRVQHERAA